MVHRIACDFSGPLRQVRLDIAASPRRGWREGALDDLGAWTASLALPDNGRVRRVRDCLGGPSPVAEASGRKTRPRWGSETRVFRAVVERL